MKIVETFNPDVNFWNEHIQLAAAGPVKKLYDEDASKKKEVSSKLMWCIVLIWDRNSKFYNLPEEDKIQTIFIDYYGSLKAFEKSRNIILEIRDFYLKLQETPALRSLREIEQKIEERTRFIRTTNYTLGTPTEKGTWVGGTAIIIDNMLANSKKIYELYEQAIKLVDLERGQKETRVKGGGNLSLTDEEKI
jgi:sulfur relay (sulfurtransferase) DsrC/TusE family protein